jgi:hypothetical protein
MKIELVLELDDETMIDETNETGLTGPAYDDLTGWLIDNGYSIESGPDKVS